MIIPGDPRSVIIKIAFKLDKAPEFIGDFILLSFTGAEPAKSSKLKAIRNFFIVGKFEL